MNERLEWCSYDLIFLEYFQNIFIFKRKSVSKNIQEILLFLRPLEKRFVVIEAWTKNVLTVIKLSWFPYRKTSMCCHMCLLTTLMLLHRKKMRSAAKYETTSFTNWIGHRVLINYYNIFRLFILDGWSNPSFITVSYIQRLPTWHRFEWLQNYTVLILIAFEYVEWITI